MAIVSCILAIFTVLLTTPSDSLHLEGVWHSEEVFFKFLTRFGFQQTFDDDKSNTEGYIYGNITLLEPQNDTRPTSELVVVDSEYFLDFYGNRNVESGVCPAMFRKIDTKAWDPICNPLPGGKEDFLRPLPCPVDLPCLNGTKADWLIQGYQFTYRVDDISKPSFWYVSMVGCSRNSSDTESCFWSQEVATGAMKYDIWLVNGHPNLKHMNPFEHQFSFEMHDIFEMYAAFFFIYSLLVPVQLYALSKQRHLLPMLLTVCMCLEYIGVLFNLLHVLVFAFDGKGVELLSVVGNFVDNVAQCLFMLLLLLVVKGWTITRMHLETRTKVVLFTLWGNYTVASMALFVWNLMEIDIISDIGEWQTWPGYIILTFRIAIMVWFLLELRETFHLEHNAEKVRFYLHFGAGFLVWFVYMPIAALICAQVSALWRYKTMLSITYAADFISYCVMTHLLWPGRSYVYFNLTARAPPIALNDFSFKGLMDTSADSASEESLDMQELSKLIKGQKTTSLQNGLILNSAMSAPRLPRFSDDPAPSDEQTSQFDEQTSRFDEQTSRFNEQTSRFDEHSRECCEGESIRTQSGDIDNDVLTDTNGRSDTNVLVEVDLHDNHIAVGTDFATSHGLSGEVLACWGEDSGLESATKELI